MRVCACAYVCVQHFQKFSSYRKYHKNIENMAAISRIVIVILSIVKLTDNNNNNNKINKSCQNLMLFISLTIKIIKYIYHTLLAFPNRQHVRNAFQMCLISSNQMDETKPLAFSRFWFIIIAPSCMYKCSISKTVV